MVKLAKEIDNINASLRKIGCEDTEIGGWYSNFPVSFDPHLPSVKSSFQMSPTGRKSLFESTVQTAIQQHFVEHAEHNKAQKKLWSSTAPGSDSRRLDLCLASGRSQLRKRE